MILLGIGSDEQMANLSRVCGDDPKPDIEDPIILAFVPRMRG